MNVRDLNIFKAFAGLVAQEIDSDIAARERFAAKQAPILHALNVVPPAIALQPIVAIPSRTITGFEALARFPANPYRTPDRWFADAAEVGLGVDLECVAAAEALGAFRWLPVAATLSINVSPSAVMSDGLALALRGAPMDRIVLEITEHAAVDDYDRLVGRLATFRDRGLRIAIDDAGAGFSSLQHILKLQPDFIKLDCSLVHDVDSDPARQALSSALLMFARRTGAVLVAEGIETSAELEILTSLGVSRGQGYLLGKPVLAADMARERGLAAGLA